MTYSRESHDRAKSLCVQFAAADAAWQIELTKAFGRRAGDERYTKRGHGESGTTLRIAYELRERARQSWDVLPTDLKGRLDWTHVEA